MLVTHFAPAANDLEAKVYPHLGSEGTPTVIGYEDDTLLADIAAYHQWKHLRGEERLKWRSGIKHDCSKVMELRREGNRYRNGLGELVELEDLYLYPMLKSSDVANGCGDNATRWMIVTQQTVGHYGGDRKTLTQVVELPQRPRRSVEQTRKFHLPQSARLLDLRRWRVQLRAVESGH